MNRPSLVVNPCALLAYSEPKGKDAEKFLIARSQIPTQNGNCVIKSSAPVRGAGELVTTGDLVTGDKIRGYMRKKVVSVIGGHDCTKEVEKLAQDLGKKLAKVVGILISGGLSGTMRAVCQGFKAGGGLTIGIIPSYDKKDANEFVDIVIPTGLGLARNVLVVKSADVVVALPGEAGTLSEIAYALQFGIPVIGLGSWDIPGVIKVKTVEEAVEKVSECISYGAQRAT